MDDERISASSLNGFRNKYIEAWKRPDAPPTLPMPLQNLYSPMPEEVLTVDPKTVSLFGQPHLRDWTSTPAGNVMWLIKQRKSARQILYDMVSEAIDILGPE